MSNLLWTQSECCLAVSLMREGSNYIEIEDNIRELREKETYIQELREKELREKENNYIELENEYIKLKDTSKKQWYNNNETFIILNDQVAILKEESKNKSDKIKILEFKNEKLEKDNSVLIQATRLQQTEYIYIRLLNIIVSFLILINFNIILYYLNVDLF